MLVQLEELTYTSTFNAFLFLFETLTRLKEKNMWILGFF